MINKYACAFIRGLIGGVVGILRTGGDFYIVNTTERGLVQAAPIELGETKPVVALFALKVLHERPQKPINRLPGL